MEIARAIRAGTISAREVTQAHLDRIAARDGELNAFTEVSADEALTAAAAADRARASGEPSGALQGVPVAVKDNTEQAGHATTNGVPAWARRVARRDAPQIARLRAAGAILIGRTNTPAFSMRWCAENDLHGRTLNPWDPERTPGGSSGGAAAALASGMVPLAHGNDYGGSIRYPAHACGVVGLRPTVGLVPRTPVDGDPDHLSWQLMSVEGPLARTVEDLALALAVMTGGQAQDPFAVPSGAERAREQPASERGSLRVALVRDPGVVAPHAAVNAALDMASGWLADAGYVVEEVELPLLAEAYRLWYLLCIEDNRRDLPTIRELGGTGATRSFETQLAVARQWWPEHPELSDLLAGYDRRGELIRRLHEFFADVPLLLTPVSTEQAFTHGEDIASDESAIRLAGANWPCMALPLLGAPGLSVPVAVANGLPVGVQLGSARFREDLLLDAAAVIQARNSVPSPI